MEIGEALYGYLTGVSALTALVSKRIYPDVLPQNVTYPAVTYSLINTERYHAFTKDTAMLNSIYSFTVHGTSRSSVHDVAKQIRIALQDYTGTMGVGGVDVKAVLIDDERDDYDDYSNIYMTDIEFQIIHTE